MVYKLVHPITTRRITGKSKSDKPFPGILVDAVYPENSRQIIAKTVGRRSKGLISDFNSWLILTD